MLSKGWFQSRALSGVKKDNPGSNNSKLFVPIVLTNRFLDKNKNVECVL